VAQAGQELEGPGGLRLRFVRTAAETGGDLLEMEADYAGTGEMPPEHLHPGQAERFTVLSGTFRAVVDGEERRYEAGDEFEIPPGVPHRMGADGPSRLRWEVRPALRTAEFFETVYGGAPIDGDLLARFSDEIRVTGG
jgi:quercetin dioxygenase-like cupin family protein